MFDGLRSQRLLALFAAGWLLLNLPLIALWDQPVRVAGEETGAVVHVTTPIATGLHQVDSPAVDRVRVVTSTGQTFRLNPNTGTLIDGDAITAGAEADPASLIDPVSDKRAAAEFSFFLAIPIMVGAFVQDP